MRLVRRFRSFTALLLLALWLPVTLHCDLEAAGLMGAEGFDCCSTEQSCSNDGCSAIESGHFKSSNDLVAVPAPELTLDWAASLVALCARSPLNECRQTVAPPAESLARPLDWVSSWRFVRRQALPARAPDCVLA